jgi:hypothetical protein
MPVYNDLNATNSNVIDPRLLSCFIVSVQRFPFQNALG